MRILSVRADAPLLVALGVLLVDFQVSRLSRHQLGVPALSLSDIQFANRRAESDPSHEPQSFVVLVQKYVSTYFCMVLVLLYGAKIFVQTVVHSTRRTKISVRVTFSMERRH